jgi:hypothetical protein
VNPSAQEAMARAEAAHIKIDAHEDLCAERYAHIHTAIGGVKASVGTVLKILAWGGSTIFGLLVVLIGFLAVRSISSNDSELQKLRQQVDQMQATATHKGEKG